MSEPEELPALGRLAEARANFRREKRSNQTHASRTNSGARLAQKSPGKNATLSYQANILMDNRHGIIVGTQVVRASETLVLLLLTSLSNNVILRKLRRQR